MMEIITRDQRLLMRAYWLVSHRWIAVILLALLTWLCKNIFDVKIRENSLYMLSIALILVNLLSLWLLEMIRGKKKTGIYKPVQFVIHFQLLCDLFIITAMLHLTGGVSNPLFIIYLSHMIIASILLSRMGAFLQTTAALLLFGLLLCFEYRGILPHYCLCMENIPDHGLYKDPYYLMKTYGVFTLSSYLLVYITASIGHRLRSQEDKLTLAREQIKFNQRLRNEYIHRMAKDVLKQSAVIQTNLSVISNDSFKTNEEKQKKLIEASFQRSQTVTNYAKDILYLTILRLNKTIHKQVISLGDIIVDSISCQYDEAEKKNISFKLSLDESIDKYYANKTLFKRAFRHLINNAIKFSGGGGEITVTTKNKLKKIVIEIADEGMGVPKEDLSRIFDEYYRADNAKKAGVRGFGIGLALVKEIVLKHKGKVWATNNHDKGTSCIIELPKQQ